MLKTVRAYTCPEVLLIDEEVVEVLAVERNHRDAFQIAPQERIVGLDVDLLERHADPLEDHPRLVT
jgi:hypothetical protein